MHVHISFDHILVAVQQLILLQPVFFGGMESPPFFWVGELFNLGDLWQLAAPPGFQKRILMWIHTVTGEFLR